MKHHGFYDLSHCLKISIILTLGLFSTFHATLESAEIMTYEEYSLINHPTLYTFELSKNNLHLFYFGANHSCNSLDMQYLPLEDFWNQFIQKTHGENCIVLVEGQLRGGPFLSREHAITNGGGEGGFITFLAGQNNIAIECPEPTEKELYYELIKKFSHDEIYYKNFAQCVLQFNRYKKNDHTLDFENFFLSRRFGNRTDLEHMKNFHKHLFNTPFNSHDEMLFYHITNPVETETIINRICRQTSIIRDKHIVEYIDKLMKQGKHVFIVYGCTHAVMQEKALRNQFLE